MVEKKKEESKSDSLVLQLDKPDQEALIEVLSIYRIIRDSSNDQLVRDWYRTLSAVFKLVNIVSSTDIMDIMERSLQDPRLDKALLNTPKVGLWGLFGALRDEEVQKGVGLMIEILIAIGKSTTDISLAKETLRKM